MTSTPLPAPQPVDATGPGQPSRAPLRRSTTVKILGGVSGGLAEHTGMIRPLGRFLLDEACRQGARWRRAGRCSTLAAGRPTAPSSWRARAA